MVSKETLREKYLKARRALSREEIEVKSARIGERLMRLESYQKSEVVFFYCSKDPEVQTRDLIGKAIQSGKKVALPLCEDKGRLQVRSIKDLICDCVEGPWGLMEPVIEKTQEVRVEDIEVFVIPGIAFDSKGHRIGWGKGYFDRFLKKLASDQLKIGLAFEVQLAPLLEIEPHDEKVDVLITENRVIYCKEE